MRSRLNLALLISVPLLLIPPASCFADNISPNISQVCAGTSDNTNGTAYECSASPAPITNGYSAKAGSIASNFDAFASEQASPGQVIVKAVTYTEPDLPDGLTATASAIGQYVDDLTFQHVTAVSGATITDTPLILAPGSAIVISESLTSELSGFAEAQTAIDFGNPGDINSVIANLDPQTGKFTFDSGNVPNGAKGSFEDLGSNFGNQLQYYIQDPNVGIDLQSVRFALTDAVSAAGNGYASINDPLSFTVYDPNGNVIPDLEIQGSSGYDYSVTDGYVPGSNPGSGPGTSVTPEPNSFLLLATGLAGILSSLRPTAAN